MMMMMMMMMMMLLMMLLMTAVLTMTMAMVCWCWVGRELARCPAHWEQGSIHPTNNQTVSQSNKQLTNQSISQTISQSINQAKWEIGGGEVGVCGVCVVWCVEWGVCVSVGCVRVCMCGVW